VQREISINISSAFTLSSSFYVRSRPAGSNGERMPAGSNVSAGSSVAPVVEEPQASYPGALSPSTHVQIPEVRMRRRFRDFPDREALDVCEQAYEDMRKVVEYAEKKFW
jgi:hypothetical protein